MRLYLCLITLFFNNVYAKSSIDYEKQYFSLEKYMLSIDVNITIDYLWDQAVNGNYQLVRDRLLASENKTLNLLKLSSKLRMIILMNMNQLDTHLIRKLILNELYYLNSDNTKSMLIILNHRRFFNQFLGAKVVNEFLANDPSLVSNYLAMVNQSDLISNDELNDVFKRSPHRKDANVKLFLFCRSNRKYKCLFLMRNKYGEIVYNQNGEIWSQPALAASKHDLPFNVRNGNTPAGVFKINSVMPKANRKLAYGKYRRFILEFISKSYKEKKLKYYLPKSSWNKSWWKENTIARDVGRNLFRIHGTGQRSGGSSMSYYPFVRTSGCIAQRENTYKGIKYIDQRLLLDTFMDSMGLEAIYENEPYVRGLLYIFNIDNQEKSVELTELREKLNF